MAKRVVVAEDEPKIREFYVPLFERLFPGHEFHYFEDGQAAWDDIEANGADLVITDINMPKMRGDELSRRVKKKDPNTPVVAIADQSLEDILPLFAAETINEFIKKPANEREYVSTIAPYLRA